MSKEESRENVADPSFSRIPLIYISPWRRKDERMEEEGSEKRGARRRGGGRTISAVCMRGRRQTLLNCPMTPYILSSEHALSRHL